jgi:hypothetical protein
MAPATLSTGPLCPVFVKSRTVPENRPGLAPLLTRTLRVCSSPGVNEMGRSLAIKHVQLVLAPMTLIGDLL